MMTRWIVSCDVFYFRGGSDGHRLAQYVVEAETYDEAMRKGDEVVKRRCKMASDAYAVVATPESEMLAANRGLRR